MTGAPDKYVFMDPDQYCDMHGEGGPVEAPDDWGGITVTYIRADLARPMTVAEAAKVVVDNFDAVWTKAVAIEAENAREAAGRGHHKWPVVCREGVRAALISMSQGGE